MVLVTLVAVLGFFGGCSAPRAATVPAAPSVAHPASTQPSSASPNGPRPTPTTTTTAPSTSDSPDGPNLDDHSTTDPASVWVVVNKKHPLPKGFEPSLAIVEQHLVASVAADGLKALLDAASGDGVPLHLASTYRSYGYQGGVYQGLVLRDGSAHADHYSARPGYSEHQTGLAVDVTGVGDATCNLKPCFGSTPAGAWVRENAARFGFIVRYTVNNRKVTGYAAEPWHLRYVGTPLAQLMQRQHIDTLEQLFGVSGGDYRH